MGNIFAINLSCDGAIVTRCWDSIFGGKHYVSKLGENLQDLKSSVEDLTSLKNDVVRRVDLAERQQLQRLNQVQTWISRVEVMETEVSKVVCNSIQQSQKLCCVGYCSKNYISSYKFGKIVAKKKLEVDALKSSGVFEEVAAEGLATALVNERPLEPTVGMESVFDKVWCHITKDEEVGVIGLYGMGGVGKTTLLTQIHNNFLNVPTDFNVVVWVVVSKDFKLEIIQDKIAEQIPIPNRIWKSKAQDQKATDIYQFLSKQKFVLLLDDIWEQVDLIKVGIPVPDKQNKSKVVFTTRSEELCGYMDAHKKIRVECLAWDSAWNLFQEKVGSETLSIHPDIPDLAVTVAKECGGLPIALITVGRAMACKKTPQEWNHAIQVLKKSASEFSGMGDKVFPLLKFSFDNLPSEKLQLCFLYCALFPEDFLIHKDELLYSWMCEELLDEYATVEEAQNESYHIIGTLVRACLLEEGEDKSVKMHDVIRDMALWLACDCGKLNGSFLVCTSAFLTKAPRIEKWNRAKRISLMANHIRDLETPKSPNLLTLFLRANNLVELPKGFFNFVPTLQVLDLSENKSLTRLPSGISRLVSMQHLNLSKSGLQELSPELKSLVRLKYLNLEYTLELNVVHVADIVSSLLMLEVLRLMHCGCDSPTVFDGEKALLKELPNLKNLNVLTLSIRSIHYFQKFLSYHRLVTSIQTLFLVDPENGSKVLDITSLVDMKQLDYFRISVFPKMEHMEIDWRKVSREANDPRNSRMTSRSYFTSLQSVSVWECNNLKDLTWLIFAPNLSRVEVSECSEMKKVIDLERLSGGANVVQELKPFAKLTRLRLMDLVVLKSIYEHALPFSHLKQITISLCPALKKLPLDSSSAQKQRCNLIIEGKGSWWDEIEWRDQVTQNAFLPCFRPLPDQDSLL